MAKQGRKRKQAKRTPSGAISRAGQPKFDRGSEWVQTQRERYGEFYNSPIGRAYAAGLLGEGSDAKDRYDKARKFVSLYGRVIGRDRYRCPLDQSPRGSDHHVADVERDAADHEWLIVNMARIDLTGCRVFFDQLTSRQFTDHGPDWLERVLATKDHDRRDTMILDAAVKGIDAIGAVNGARIVLLVDRAA